MILVNTYFYISSILFLIGTNYLSKQICERLEITKELTFIISLTIILTLCLISYSFNILNFNSESTQYKITYNGTPNIFLNDMRKNNFEFEMKNNIWILK